jgi:hypothetical protein
MVECKDGKCSIAEADWRQFQEFHALTHKRMGQINAEVADTNRTMRQLMGQLAACMSRQPEREI